MGVGAGTPASKPLQQTLQLRRYRLGGGVDTGVVGSKRLSNVSRPSGLTKGTVTAATSGQLTYPPVHPLCIPVNFFLTPV